MQRGVVQHHVAGGGVRLCLRGVLGADQAAGDRLVPQHPGHGKLGEGEAARRGDPFLWPAEVPLSSERALAARFGPGFAAAAIELPAERWSEPIASSYGLHLVWVRRRFEGRLPPLDEVRSEVTGRWREQRETEALAQALAALRRDVDVRVAAAPEPAAPGG